MKRFLLLLVILTVGCSAVVDKEAQSNAENEKAPKGALYLGYWKVDLGGIDKVPKSLFSSEHLRQYVFRRQYLDGPIEHA